MGQPNRGAAASVPGTVSNGNAATDGAAYRPISPASGGTFPDIFRGYTTVNNTGRFPPRVHLLRNFWRFGGLLADLSNNLDQRNKPQGRDIRSL
jgi:hypothetical protein